MFAFGLHLIAAGHLRRADRHAAREHSLRPPGWVYIALAVLAAAALVGAAFPAGRRLARSAAGARPWARWCRGCWTWPSGRRKLAEGIGGALLLTAAYIFCLDASVRAVGGSVPLASVAVVYLAGNALGSVVPTPGGLGAVEAALSAGLTAAGLPGAAAVSAVLLFRTC